MGEYGKKGKRIDGTPMPGSGKQVCHKPAGIDGTPPDKKLMEDMKAARLAGVDSATTPQRSSFNVGWRS